MSVPTSDLAKLYFPELTLTVAYDWWNIHLGNYKLPKMTTVPTNIQTISIEGISQGKIIEEWGKACKLILEILEKKVKETHEFKNIKMNDLWMSSGVARAVAGQTAGYYIFISYLVGLSLESEYKKIKIEFDKANKTH